MLHVRRRDLMALLAGAAAAWPLAARAQQPDRMRRIGVLMHLSADDLEGQARFKASTHVSCRSFTLTLISMTFS